MQVSSFTSSFRKYLKRLCAIAFLCVIIFLLLSYYCRLARNDRDGGLYNLYYGINSNTADVLCIGSSHIYCSINPVQMYEDYGITAYNLAEGSQAVWFSYYYLKEALKTQSPKIVVLDTYMLPEEDSYFSEKIYMNLLAMRPSYTKYQALKIADADRDNFVNLFWGFPVTHTRYGEINQQSYETDESRILGYHFSNRIEEYEEYEDIATVTNCVPVSKKAEEYLRKVIELCKENNINVVLINAPWPCITKEFQMKYNYTKKVAEEYNIPFLDGCLDADKIGIDYTKDCMGDGGHLNDTGATKFTTWLEQYLVSHYELPDHRGEKKYVYWEESADKLYSLKRQLNRSKSENAADYVQDVMKDSDCLNVLLYNGKEGELPEDIKARLNLDGFVLDKPSAYVFDSNGIVFAAYAEDTYQYHTYLNKNIVYIESDGEIQTLKIDSADIFSLDTSKDTQIDIYTMNEMLGEENANEMIFDLD